MFLSPGTLRLTQQALSDSSDSTPRWRRLLPRQTYLSVDEDAAQILERKRNFLYCVAVRILKEKKEMHIDNLVFKVRRRRRSARGLFIIIFLKICFWLFAFIDSIK